jgi:formate-dependent nitrite reductase membrane component NrfD
MSRFPGNGSSPGNARGGAGRRRRGGRGERAMVPEATFASYYGRPVIKAPVWKADIPGYLFMGGLAAGSSLLGAGGDLTGRPALVQAGRLSGLGGILVSFGLLVHDLGRPDRFLNMLRVAKPTSPMSVGTWILTAYGPLAGLAAGAHLLPPPLRRRTLGRLVAGLGRPAGLGAAALAPLVASYTAVLIADTAVPSWHEAYPELPFVFVGSAAAAAGGLAMITVPTTQAAPARRAAVLGAVLDLAAAQRMESRLGLVGEPFSEGRAGTLLRTAKALTGGGAVVGALLGRRSRVASALAGAALLAGSACTRFGIFEAGVASAKDPKYTVIPQRERVNRNGSSGVNRSGPQT